MPELPEVERVRRMLEPAMTGARFERVTLNRPDLRRPFPRGFARRLRGRKVRALTRRGKYLVAELSTGDALIMHLGMSGWFRIERTAARPLPLDRDLELEHRHDHVIFQMSSGMTVVFSDPRRFGVMDLVTADRLLRHALAELGPEPLSRAFDARQLARVCANRRVALKVALLDQRAVAGLGNIYASEALHLARLSPLQPAAAIATPTGAPRPASRRLAAAIKAVLRRAIALKEADRYQASRFRVYDREGEHCVTPGCRGRVARIEQAGRSTFFCPLCQR